MGKGVKMTASESISRTNNLMKWFDVITPRVTALLSLCIFCAGCGAVVVGQTITPGDVRDAAGTLAGMTTTELFAVLALLALGFAAWIFWRLTETLRQLSMNFASMKTELENRPCIYSVMGGRKLNIGKTEE